MVELLHEFWEDEDGHGGEFGPVNAHNDKTRPVRQPGARLVFSIYASSWHQAMQIYQEREGLGEYLPPDGILDHVYTDIERIEQDRYLSVRNL